MRLRVRAVVLGALVFGLILELASYTAIAVLNRTVRPPIERTPRLFAVVRQGLENRLVQYETAYELDSVLGWRYTPTYRIGFHSLNSQRLRADRAYDSLPPPGLLRVAAFGDSFVYGSELPVADAWAARIERAFPLEVLNYGVRGYGNDQALLRLRLEGHALRPQVVLLGFIPDDLNRLVSVFRPFWTPQVPSFTKPRFVLGPRDELRTVASPLRTEADYRRLVERPERVRDLGRLDAWYEPLVYANPLYDWSATVRLATAAWIRLERKHLSPGRLVRGEVFNQRSEAYRLQLRVFEEFRTEAASHGEAPLVLLLPDDRVVARIRAGQVPVHAPLRDDLARLQVPYLDAADAFRAQADSIPTAAWFMEGGHYSAAGSEVIARWLGPRLLAIKH